MRPIWVCRDSRETDSSRRLDDDLSKHTHHRLYDERADSSVTAAKCINNKRRGSKSIVTMTTKKKTCQLVCRKGNLWFMIISRNNNWIYFTHTSHAHYYRDWIRLRCERSGIKCAIRYVVDRQTIASKQLDSYHPNAHHPTKSIWTMMLFSYLSEHGLK